MKIKAQVSDRGLSTISNYFRQSPDVIIREMLQNARRAKATRVAVSAILTPTGSLDVSFSDDGEGIDDPSKLLHLWESGWDDATEKDDKPAGMGFFSLAHVPSGVYVMSKDWSLHIPTEVFHGNGYANTVGSPFRKGTLVSFTLENIGAPEFIELVERAATYFPLPVEVCGKPVERLDFLKDATYVEHYGDYTIGVYLPTDRLVGERWNGSDAINDQRYAWGGHAATSVTFRSPAVLLNFHGALVSSLGLREHYNGAYVLVDIHKAAALDLLSPAREAVVENDKMRSMSIEIRKATYNAIRHRCLDHALPRGNWLEAESLGVELPEAAPIMKLRQPAGVFGRDCVCSKVAPKNAGLGELLDLRRLAPAADMAVADMDAAEVLALHMSESDSVPTLLVAKPEFEGYAWYDALPRISGVFQILKHGSWDFRVSPDFETDESSSWSSVFDYFFRKHGIDKCPAPPDSIQLEIQFANGDTRVVDTHVAFTAVGEYGGGDALGCDWIATDNGKVTANDLRSMFYYTPDGEDRDTAEREFIRDAELERVRRLEGSGAADRMTLDRIVNSWEFTTAVRNLKLKSLSWKSAAYGRLKLVFPAKKVAKRKKPK